MTYPVDTDYRPGTASTEPTPTPQAHRDPNPDDYYDSDAPAAADLVTEADTEPTIPAPERPLEPSPEDGGPLDPAADLSHESEAVEADPVEHDPARLLTADDVAALLGVSNSSVRKWRHLGRGPRWFKVGGGARYRLVDVLGFKEAHPNGFVIEAAPPKRSPLDGLMTAAEVAALLRVTPATLGNWRAQGVGPEHYRHTNRVGYDRADVEAWINRQAEEADRADGVADGIVV